MTEETKPNEWGPFGKLIDTVAKQVREKSNTEIERVQAQLRDYEEWHADHKRLVRELDVAINGEDRAAPQASLCDVLAQIRVDWPRLQSELNTALERVKGLEDRAIWRPIETAPKDKAIIVAAANTYSNAWTVGEAYWHDGDGEWWWANISPGEYTGDSIVNMNGPVEFWRPMPEHPEARAVLQSEGK